MTHRERFRRRLVDAKPPGAPAYTPARDRHRAVLEDALRASLDDLYAFRDVAPPMSPPDIDGFSWAPEGWNSGS